MGREHASRQASRLNVCLIDEKPKPEALPTQFVAKAPATVLDSTAKQVAKATESRVWTDWFGTPAKLIKGGEVEDIFKSEFKQGIGSEKDAYQMLDLARSLISGRVRRLDGTELLFQLSDDGKTEALYKANYALSKLSHLRAHDAASVRDLNAFLDVQLAGLRPSHPEYRERLSDADRHKHKLYLLALLTRGELLVTPNVRNTFKLDCSALELFRKEVDAAVKAAPTSWNFQP